MMVFGLILAAVVGASPVAAHGSVAITTTEANEWVGIEVQVDAWDQPTVRVEQEAVHGDASLVGAVVTHTSNGNVRITRSGPRVNARTSNGEVEVGIASLGGGAPNVELHSSNGGLTLEVPKGFATRVEAHTSNGHIDNPFASASGAGTVMMRTSNGNIDVQVIP